MTRFNDDGVGSFGVTRTTRTRRTAPAALLSSTPRGRGRVHHPATRVAVIVVAGLSLITATRAEASSSYAVGPCSPSCVDRVKQRFIRLRERAEWRDYKRNPMPWCTWGPESDTDPVLGLNYTGRPWAPGRYRIPNRSGGTGGGKFQIQLGTWAAYGGRAYAWNPIHARRLHQERVARRIAYAGTVVHRPQGLGAWVNCR